MALSHKSAAGQTSALHHPRWPVIGRILLREAGAFAVLLVPPLAVAALEGQARLTLSLGAAAALALLATAVGRRVAPPPAVRRSEAVLSVVMVFVLGILLTAPAFMALDLGPLDALFEATSALTTTGFSMIAAPEALPLAGHVLRAWSQWCGGLVIAVAALAFLMGRGPVSRALGTADFGEEPQGTSVRRHARALLLAYAVLTLVGVAGAVVLIPGTAEGPLLALAAVSTGGMAPRGDSLASYSVAAQGWIVGLSALGGLSLALPVLAHRHGTGAAMRATGLKPALVFVLAGVATALLLAALSGARTTGALWGVALNTLSLQSTTGFTVAPLPAAPPLLILLIALMMVGGQAGSTAGGLKIERVRLLLGTVLLVIRRLLGPARAVFYLRQDGELVEEPRVTFAVALTVVYLLSALALWIAFALHGLPAAESLFDITAALSTVGAGTGVIGPDLPPDLKALTICAMLLGRVEFFGLLVLAFPSTWIRKD
ncbi:TrkH family potassium uptake protein [Maliponia aquimaris]|uniref:Trk system potassium uptake protein TrkG n=1 Tax=Maliponia aquimaris TaxID=1673631 RepID=A0A238K2X0_9RHOB|nr:potassium transporter TrkG [Maliponia aquimaris]SMX36462.1 Trk system potassium uptake protein TrkG [Maliponia aquimaris]